MDQKQFSNKDWVAKLGKEYRCAESEGLLLVGEIAAMVGPNDRALSKLLELGGLDSSGAVIDSKTQKDLAETLAAIIPFPECSDAMKTGKFKLQIQPMVRVQYKGENDQNNFVFFSPHPSPGNSDGLSTVIEGSESPSTFLKARSVAIEEYYRRPGTAPRIADAFKIWKAIADDFHKDLMQQLFARCASQFGGGQLDDPEKAFKNVHDWRDIPFDLKSSLSRQRTTFVGGNKSLPETGTIANVNWGIDIRVIFAGSSGMAKSYGFSILK